MSNYIHLDDSLSLPLLDKELFYVNPYKIILTSDYRDQILSSLDYKSKKQILIGWSTGAYISYPRFNLSDYFYKIKPNDKINFLPNVSKALDTETLFDQRSLELYQLSKQFENVYVFWSGGVDSTLILAAILKNWPELEKLVVVLNHFSVDEHKSFYEKYISNKLRQTSTDEFFNNQIKFNHNSIYVTGDLGGPLITFDDSYDDFKKQYPGKLNKSWRTEIDTIIRYFSTNSNRNLAVDAVSKIIKSSIESRIPIETVHDFFWWIEFNWAYDTDLVYMLWQYQDLDYTVDTKRFLETNVFYWFNSQDCQNWAVSLVGSDLRDRHGIFKYAFKKYIYDFDRDDHYYRYKGKEISTPKNPQVFKNKQILAIDTDYNMYYRNIKI